MEYRGKYIAIEGIDGVGKTTQAQLLKNWFESLDIPIFTTRELSDGLIGKFSRDLLHQGLYLPPKTLALLWASDTQHNQEKPEGVVSHLKQGNCVLSDRCYLSAYAYLFPECETSWISELHKFCLIPDITIFLDLDPEIALKRIEKRNEKLHEFETLASLIRIRENYLTLIKLLKDTWKQIEIIKLNESTSIDELQQAIRQGISRYLVYTNTTK
jgi:dTMP kinase